MWRRSSRGAASGHLDLASVALLAFASLALPAVMGGEVTGRGAVFLVAGTQAAVLVGLLGAAVWWRREQEDEAAVGRRGATCGVLFAVANAAAVWLAAAGAGSLAAGVVAPALVAGSGLLAGVALAALLYSNQAHCGHYTSAYLAGGVGALLLGARAAGASVAAPSAPLDAGLLGAVTVLLVGGAGAVGALLLLRGRVAGAAAAALGGVAGVVLAASAAPLVWDNLAPAGALPLILRITPWLPPDAALEILRSPLIWLCATLAVLAPVAFLGGMHRDQSLGLARLHIMALLWAAATALLVWPLLARAAGWAGRGSALSAGLGALVGGGHAGGDMPALQALIWIAVGAVIGGMAADAWPLGRVGLNRVCVAGVAGAAIALVLTWAPLGTAHPGSTSAALGAGLRYPEPALVVLLVAAGALLSLALPMVAGIGALVGPVHPVWLWASWGMASFSILGYLSRLGASHHAGWQAWTSVGRLLFSVAGLGAVVLFILVTSEISLAPSRPAEIWRWVKREWGLSETSAVSGRGGRVPQGSYPLWLLVLRILTYLGYLPWWMASGLLRAIWSAVYALAAMVVGVISGLVGSLLALILGKPLPTTAQRVVLAQEPAPLVSLARAEDRKPGEGEEEKAEQGVLGYYLSLPMLALVAGVAWLAHVRARRAEPLVEEEQAAGPETQVETETLGIGPPPDVVPGAAATPEAAREQALRKRLVDPPWRRWLRGVGASLGTWATEWLAPDAPEPWDERFFRAETIGPRGRRFELVGHLWRSRRRCGCIVTVPILSGRVEKAVEVRSHHRALRELFETDPEQVKKILLRAAFRMAVRDLNAGLVASRTVECESPREDLLEPHQDRYCELREELPGIGYRCRQPLPQDATRGGTTLSACARCNLPEVWERCSNLKLEGTTGFQDDEERLHRRAHLMCRLTEKIVPAEECLSKDCFSPSVITRVIALDHIHTR